MKEIWISTKEANSLLKTYNVKMTKTGLYYIGFKNKFARKAEDGFHTEYEKNKLLDYIKRIIQDPPEGWFSIVDVSNKLKVRISFVYSLINNKKIKYKIYGRKHINYVREDEIKEYMKAMKEGFLSLNQITKFYRVSKTILLKNISLGKLNTKKFEGDDKIYVNKEEVEKLFKCRETRETDKGSDNG
jgi:hypothetical protein